MSRLQICAGILVLVGAGATAQSIPPRGFPLTIDFLALDARGNPIGDLRPDEIEVRLGRQKVEIRALRLLPAASAARSTVERSRPQPFESAEAVNFERTFLIVVDDESLPQGSEQSTRDALRSFVRRLDPRDLIGLAVIPHGDLRLLPTTDHGRILQSVSRVSGRATRQESAADAACRTQNVLRELDALQAATESASGPLTVLLFSGSLYDGAAQLPLGTSMACDIQLADFRQLGLRAARSRSYFYIVQPATFDSLPWTSSPRAGLEHLAGTTGGRILDLSGRDADVLERVRIETSALYIAQVSLPNRPKSAQMLSVKTSRPDVLIVARPQVSMPDGRSTPR